MLDEFPLGPRWAAELFGAVVPASKIKNILLQHREPVAAQLVRAIMFRSASLQRIIECVKVANFLLERAYDLAPEPTSRIVDATLGRIGELQQKEFSLEDNVRTAGKDELEAKFGSFLDLYEFTHEQYFRTLAAPFVVADALTRTKQDLAKLVDADGRTTPAAIEEVETGNAFKKGALTDGLNRHMRNSAAHHRYSVLSDDLIRLWDVTHLGQYTWGPVEWNHWTLRTEVYRLSNTCSVLLLALIAFDISNAPTVTARGWRETKHPKPLRRDIVRSELNAMASLHGFDVLAVASPDDTTLVISLRVNGQTVLEQNTRIFTGGGTGPTHAFQQTLRTEWGDLRRQVYGFLQMTMDTHAGYASVIVNVVSDDGTVSLGEVAATISDREAMWKGKPIEEIQKRLSSDTLADVKIPVIIKGPVRPV